MLSFIVNRELGNYVGNYYCGYCTVCDWLSGAARRGRVEARAAPAVRLVLDECKRDGGLCNMDPTSKLVPT